ncbi:adenylate kinase [bacterium]|nr:adenylate kinase [bacterium]
MRIVILGTSCSGKTTLSKELSRLYDIPHFEIDAIYWGPGWTAKPLDEFREYMREVVQEKSWIIDGNYNMVADIVWLRAQTIIWLDLSFPVVFWRVLRRTGKRIIHKEKLFSGNRESIRLAFLSKDSLIWYVIKTFYPRRRIYERYFKDGKHGNCRVIRLRTQNQIYEFVESCLKMGKSGFLSLPEG